jgi:hypothetical protein
MVGSTAIYLVKLVDFSCCRWKVASVILAALQERLDTRHNSTPGIATHSTNEKQGQQKADGAK